jgi:hypothetical protein
MVLSEVEETITTREIDEETFEEIIKVFGFLATLFLLRGSDFFGCFCRKQKEILKCCSCVVTE